MPAITPLNVGLLPVSGHTDVRYQGRQRTERATISSNDSPKKPLYDGSINSLRPATSSLRQTDQNERSYTSTHNMPSWCERELCPPPPTSFHITDDVLLRQQHGIPCAHNSPLCRKLTKIYRSNLLPVAVSKHRNLSGK